jgi:hypothetical protein
MSWGTVLLSPEVRRWLDALSDDAQARVLIKLGYLEANGPLLGEPHTRQLGGKLRELRIALERDQVRISYFIASGRRIVMLTVFRKQRPRERREIQRAQRAQQRWRIDDSGERS